MPDALRQKAIQQLEKSIEFFFSSFTSLSDSELNFYKKAGTRMDGKLV